MKVNITNIKLSFSYHEKIIFDDAQPILNYHTGLVRIVKFDSYTASLMANDTYLNLTGLKNSYQILDSLKKLVLVSNINPNRIEYKIDTIAAVFLLKKNIRSIILQSASDLNLLVEVKIRFCGVTIRSPLFGNAVCVYFQSGKCLLTGAKDFDQIKLISQYMFSKFGV